MEGLRRGRETGPGMHRLDSVKLATLEAEFLVSFTGWSQRGELMEEKGRNLEQDPDVWVGGGGWKILSIRFC